MLFLQKSYHVICAKPKMIEAQARLLAKNWGCWSRRQLGDYMQNSQLAPAQNTPEDFAV